MIIYNVTYSIDPAIESEWLQWMKEYYIVKIDNTKLVASCKLLQLLTEIEEGGVTYTCQLSFESTENLVRFEEVYEHGLENEHYVRFQGKYGCFRTLLKEV